MLGTKDFSGQVSLGNVRLNEVILCQITELLKALNMGVPLVVVHEKESAAFCNLIGRVNFFHALTGRIRVPWGLLWGNPALKQLGRKVDKRQKYAFSLWRKPT